MKKSRSISKVRKFSFFPLLGLSVWSHVSQVSSVLTLKGALYSSTLDEIILKTKGNLYYIQKSALTAIQQRGLEDYEGEIVLSFPISGIRRIRPVPHDREITGSSQSLTEVG